jgi:hypothetical protein
LNAAIEIRVDQTDGDTEVGRQASLGFGAILLDRLEQSQHHAFVVTASNRCHHATLRRLRSSVFID